MPEYKIPVGCGSLLLYSDACSVDGDNDKTEVSSLRSSSPKSASSCTDDVGSIVSDGPSEDAAERSAAILAELSEDEEACHASAATLYGLEEDLETNLSLSEGRAEELMAQGADMRHVLCTSWKLQPKMEVGMRLRKAAAPSVGRVGQQALRDAASVQKKAIQVEFERYSARNNIANALRSRGNNGLRTGRPPPGFERRLFDTAALLTDVSPASRSGPTPILVSYADGSNTLSLALEPLTLHDITVSCVADTCHIFLSQMKNPTYVGLEPLEMAMYEAYNEKEAAAATPLLRPIATGSLLAVFSDDKWYRCQVVAYHPAADTCDIKFVDHGGYTTVSVDELRPLRSDFVRLPFQAVEVYVAAIRSAFDEIMIDITSDLLFRKEVSVQLLGYARDGVPMVQIYFYQADYIHLLTQEIVDDCYRTYLRAHPDHVVVLPQKAYLEEGEEEGSVCWSEEGTTCGADESGIGTGSEEEGEGEEEEEDWSQQVENWSEGDSTLAINTTPVEYTEDAAAAYTPVYSPEMMYGPETVLPAYYVPEPCTPVLYYVADPSGGACFYPVVAAPIYPLEGGEIIYPMIMPEQTGFTEIYSHHEVEALYNHNQMGEMYPHTEEYSHTEVEEYSCTQVEEFRHTEEEEEEYSHNEVEEFIHSEVEAVHCHSQVEVIDSAVGSSDEFEYVDESFLAELESKPFEEWSQADYERYYQLH